MKQDKLQTDAGRRRFIAASLAMSAAAALPFSGYARQPAPRSTGTGSDDKNTTTLLSAPVRPARW